MVLIHYPKANDSADDDPNNSINRKDAYLELEILKGDVINFLVKKFLLFFFDYLFQRKAKSGLSVYQTMKVDILRKLKVMVK